MASSKKSEQIRLEMLRAELGEKYYQNMEKMFDEYDLFLHDIRYTIRTIAALAEEGNCEEIKTLINQQSEQLEAIEKDMICRNKIVNALLVEKRAYAKQMGIAMDIDYTEPTYLHEIDDLDLIVLIGNLLDNAIAAEKQAKQKDGIYFSIWTAQEGKYTLIQVENSYDAKRAKKEKSTKHGKIGEKHGLGLRSINRIVQKYNGVSYKDEEGGRYRIKILIPIECMWEKDKK